MFCFKSLSSKFSRAAQGKIIMFLSAISVALLKIVFVSFQRRQLSKTPQKGKKGKSSGLDETAALREL